MPIKILAHRGLWSEIKEQNTIIAFKNALEKGFGIETDLRDYNGKVVVSHDIPNSDCITAERFFELSAKYPDCELALNVKSDGLQDQVSKHRILNSHFFFDMSVPDSLGYVRKKLEIYTRYSDIEPTPSFYSESTGIWLDQFYSKDLELTELERFLLDGKRVALVSPELHKFEKTMYWEQLKEFIYLNQDLSNNLSLCTDFPEEAEDFFNA